MIAIPMTRPLLALLLTTAALIAVPPVAAEPSCIQDVGPHCLAFERDDSIDAIPVQTAGPGEDYIAVVGGVYIADLSTHAVGAGLEHPCDLWADFTCS